MSKDSPLKNYIIDYRLFGSVTLSARSPKEAQEKFDRQWAGGVPRYVNEAEVASDPPAEEQP